MAEIKNEKRQEFGCMLISCYRGSKARVNGSCTAIGRGLTTIRSQTGIT